MSEQDATLDEFTKDEQKEDTDTGLRKDGFLTLPYDWEISTVKDVAKEGGLVDGDWIESSDMDDDGKIQLVQLSHIGEGQFRGKPDRFINEEFADEENCTILSEGDLLISRMQEPILRSCLLPEFEYDCVMAVDIARLQHTEDWNRHFLKYLFNSRPVWKQGIAWASGTTRKRISRKNMEKLRLPTPSITEQRKIASVLYTVDQAIQKTEQTREKAKSVEEAAKTEFFTQRYSDWEIQESVGWRCRANKFPKAWEVKTADELMEITRGASPRPRSDDSLFGGDIPWIKIGDANRGESKRIEEVDSYVTEKGKDKSKFVEEGTLLVANSGATCGFSIFAGVDGCVHDGWLILRGYDDFSPDFLYHYINWNYDYLQSLSLGSAQTNLSTSLFGRLDIPIPPLQEQQQIVEALDSIGEVISLASTEIERLQRLKQGLMQDLLSGEVRTHDKDIEILDDVLQHG